MARILFSSLLLLLALAGCAAKGSFPSLAPRAAEKLSMDEPVREAPVAAPDNRLPARAAEWLAQARQGQAAFEAALPAARARAAAAGAATSESWIEAQMALSRLEAARAPTVTALAQLDALIAAQAGLPTNPDDLAAMQDVMETVAELARAQQEAIDRLRTSLSPV